MESFLVGFAPLRACLIRSTDESLESSRVLILAEKCKTYTRWGLVPHWAKDIKFGTKCINARSETVASMAAFKDAFKRKRCLIPATAFFEWSGEKGQKTKWRITVKDEPLFAFAGLWEWWRDPSKPREPGVETYTILTTEPNDLSDIHDRMPVIVREEDYDEWLEEGSPELLRPIPSEMVEMARA